MSGEEKNRGAGHRMTWVGHYYHSPAAQASAADPCGGGAVWITSNRPWSSGFQRANRALRTRITTIILLDEW